MSATTEPQPETAPPPAALMLAWLWQSNDLLALTDAAGHIAWANPGFVRASGIQANGELLSLAPTDWQDGRARTALQAALRTGHLADGTEIGLRDRSGTALWVRARVSRISDQWLWTLQDITASRELAARAQRQSELLDMAQEYGRLGVWEREIPSGKGHWDRHVFEFWGLDAAGGTPDHAEAAARIHPEDLTPAYEESTRQAGRYSYRYRIVRPDGSMRWLHSQWEVKNSPQGQPDRAIGIILDDTEVYELARTLDSTATQLKLAVNLGNIVLWRHDLKTQRVSFNDHAFTVLGMPYRADGLTIEESRAFTHPEDVPKLAASAEQALRTDQPVDVETRHRRSDGVWRYMHLRRVVERSPSGEALAFLGVTLDITEQAEHARRAAELTQHLQSAAQAARVGIWTTTTTGEIHTEWNAQMYELFDMVGASRPPTLAEWVANCVHPDDAARVRKSASGYLRGDNTVFEIEFRVRRRDGRQRWMVLRADIDRNPAEAPRVFGIAMDVTDRHEALAAMHAASERAALIARHAGIGTWETQGGDLPALWDDQMFRLRGLAPRAKALNRAERLALVHPDDRARVIDVHADLNIDLPPMAYEFRVILPDGSVRWLASRSTALNDAQGQAARRVGVNWDITESKSAELARQQAVLAARESQAKSRFLSRMSHELRTPLNAVLGFTQLLQLEAQQPSPLSDAGPRLALIRTAGEHLLALIDDALDLSSLEAGMLKLDLQPISLAAAAARALPLVEALAASKGITVRADRLGGTALADPTRLHQVLLNLLTNAIKYNHPGGEVRVESRVGNDLVHLSVRDTGRGLRPDQLAHLFEPFNRLGVEAEGIEGTGIGLTIVKALVEGMGGRVGVSSQPGEGTLFEVTLPDAGSASAQEPALDGSVVPVAPPTPARPERSGQLLYIEDNSVNVLLVEELVKTLAGLQIVCEATGAAGVARARSLRPDVILVDLQLPDFDGFEVLRRLRASPDTAGIPCIALSANAMPEDIARGLASGFDDYWTKPIRFKPFLDALERLFPVVSET
jgi:PAS domain S-box-containing protein